MALFGCTGPGSRRLASVLPILDENDWTFYRWDARTTYDNERSSHQHAISYEQLVGQIRESPPAWMQSHNEVTPRCSANRSVKALAFLEVDPEDLQKRCYTLEACVGLHEQTGFPVLRYYAACGAFRSFRQSPECLAI